MFLEKDIGNLRCFSIANRLRKLYNIVIEKDLIIWKRNLYQQSVIIKLHLVLIVNGRLILPANCFMVLITVTKKITTEMFIAMCGLNKNINLDFSKSVYINCRTPITINCKLHGEFEVLPKNVADIKCRICAMETHSGYRYSLTCEEYKIVASTLHKNKYDYSLLNDMKLEKIPIICPIHGIFMMRKGAHISKTQLYGCQKCGRSYSKGEEIIENWCIENKINYISQKKFPGLKNKNTIFYDFYLPDHNILLEFDGSHHFKPIKYGRSQTIEEQHKKFESIKDSDGKKLTYAMDNRINMIRIMYTRINDLKHILNYEILDINTNITLDTPYITYLMENNTPVWSIKGYS